jgi:hypothetical protein
MSVSRHPVALSLERQVGGATRLLATVMALPLIDGIFPALILAGALSDPSGVLETGLLIFGGSATVAVILAEMDGTPREQARAILLLGAILVPAAAAEAAIAPTIQSLLDMVIFQRFAGLVILAVAAKTASAKVGEYLPRPAVIIGLGMIASFRPDTAELAFVAEPSLIASAAAAAGVGVGFALAVALSGPRLRGVVDIDRFRFGSSVALGLLALSVLGLMPTEAPVALGALVVTAAFAVDPDANATLAGDEIDVESPPSDDAAVGSDGEEAAAETVDAGRDDSETPHEYASDETSRAPWL